MNEFALVCHFALSRFQIFDPFSAAWRDGNTSEIKMKIIRVLREPLFEKVSHGSRVNRRRRLVHFFCPSLFSVTVDLFSLLPFFFIYFCSHIRESL